MMGENQIMVLQQKRESILVRLPDEGSYSMVADFMRSTLAAYGVPERRRRRMLVAFDELYANIVRYSKADSVSITCGLEGCSIVLTLRDDGEPYNPLEAEAPDTSLGAGEREAGGLGLFIVRRMVDSMEYSYVDGCNMLTVAMAI